MTALFLTQSLPLRKPQQGYIKFEREIFASRSKLSSGVTSTNTKRTSGGDKIFALRRKFALAVLTSELDALARQMRTCDRCAIQALVRGHLDQHKRGLPLVTRYSPYGENLHSLCLQASLTHLLGKCELAIAARSKLSSGVTSTNTKRTSTGSPFCIGRGDKIRTCGLYVPNVALYQTEPHLVIFHTCILYHLFKALSSELTNFFGENYFFIFLPVPSCPFPKNMVY